VDRFSRVVKAVRPEAEPLDLGDVLGQAVENLVAEVPAAAPRLHIQAAPGLRLTADRDLLTQAFLIVLKNAVEASADAPVRAAGRRSGPKVEVLISDEGPGFPADVADRVFEPFFSTKENGLGIGLYLARRIIEAHGGTIEVHSREGEGTEFRISLPGA
ncbi:MAG: sensor histidine kinase, partial [Candidatus Aminicenantales bacterium]